MLNTMLKLSVHILLLCYVLSEVRSKLLLVHAIFRHGEKMPDYLFMLPDDPYRNDLFYPYGPSQLTNKGKRTMFDLGKKFRRRYGEFLDDIYTPDILDAWASSFDRCQTSLQLVLAALFPPKGIQIWEEGLHWQPIAYKSLPRQHDDLFMGILMSDYQKLYKGYYSGQEGKSIKDRIRPLLSYINEHSNATLKTLQDLAFVNDAWNSEEQNGLTIPDWSKKIYPQPLGDVAAEGFALQLATKAMARKAVGKLVRKILGDCENRIAHKSNYKLHLYSGNDVTIGHILTFLKIKYKSRAGHAATVLLELYEGNGTYFIEVYYRDNKHSKFEPIRFSNGEMRLYLHELQGMVHELYRDDVQELQSNDTSVHKKEIMHVLLIIVWSYYFCGIHYK